MPPGPHQRRKRGKRKSHTIRGLLERDPSTLTWQQKLELEDLQRKRAHLSSGGGSGKRARVGDDDGEAPPTPNHTTAVRVFRSAARARAPFIFLTAYRFAPSADRRKYLNSMLARPTTTTTSMKLRDSVMS